MTLSNPAQYISGRTVQEQMNSLIDYVDQRAADVALDAIASDVAQVHQDMLDADADATAAAASAAAAAGTLANAVKKTGEASQSIAGDIAVAGALSGGSISSSGNVDGASIGSGATPITCGDLTAYGSVSLDDTVLQGNLSGADSTALINLAGVSSVLVPTPSGNSEAANKKYVDDSLAGYVPMVRTTGNQNVSGMKNMSVGFQIATILSADMTPYTWYKVAKIAPTKYIRLTYNVSLPYNNQNYMIMDAAVITPRAADSSKISVVKMAQVRNILNSTEYLGVAYDGNDFCLYIKTGTSTHSCLYATAMSAAAALVNAADQITPVTPVAEDPTTYTDYVIV